jgi:hypothetical protein
MGITLKVIEGALPENAKITKSVQVWWNGRRHLRRRGTEDPGRRKISENSIRITPRWW